MPNFGPDLASEPTKISIYRAFFNRMKRFLTTFLLAAALLFGAAGSAVAQSGGVPHARNGEVAFDAKALRKDIDSLCGPACNGRKTGTPGGRHAAEYIARRMQDLGLKPLRGNSYEIPFTVADGVKGCNVAGIFPGQSDKYVVVGAHFDHLGRLDGKLYPGADKNASGVGALLSIGHMVRKMILLGKNYNKGLILVAFDAKEMNLAGSEAFVKAVEDGALKNPSTGNAIRIEDISLMINLDVLGSTLSPADGGREDYILVLTGSNTYLHNSIKARNEGERIHLEIIGNYYGSEDFTRLFYKRVSDQKAFLDRRIPAVMFTSGITMNTNKTTDTPETLDYTVLRRRILLIYYFLAARL